MKPETMRKMAAMKLAEKRKAAMHEEPEEDAHPAPAKPPEPGAGVVVTICVPKTKG